MNGDARPPRSLPPMARVPVGAIALILVAVLLLLANEYGFHRDELYFIVAGRHPDWGYVDQPPLTPLLSAGAVALLGESPFAVRVLPALAAAGIVALSAAIARELGGGRGAQVLAAGSVALSAVMGLGHLGSTTTYDVLAWTAVAWLLMRLLRGGDRRLWLVAGVVAGIGLQNKHLVLLLGLGLLIGLAVARRWDVLRSPWAWASAGLAVLIWLPNLAWQAANGFPQLAMGAEVAGRTDPAEALLVLPFQLILAGPMLWPVLVAGLWWLLRSPAAVAWRPIGWAYLVIVLVTILVRGQVYYPAGLIPAVLAAGALPLTRWLDRGRRLLRRATLGVAAAGSGAAIGLIMLPLLPPAVLARTPLPAIYESGEQIGWEELVATVEGVVADLPPADRQRAVVFTANYGEAGALTLLGSPAMPPVHSGHNSFARWGPPPDALEVVVLVGHWGSQSRAEHFADCDPRAVIDNAARIENEERGAGVWVCRLRSPWSQIWDDLAALG